MTNGVPGCPPTEIFNKLNDECSRNLLRKGVFDLIKVCQPLLLNGSERSETLARALELEQAVDDPLKRKILVSTVSGQKQLELERRVDKTIKDLVAEEALDQVSRRNLLGFFGFATLPSSKESPLRLDSDVQPQRGLFPHQKRAASEVEKHLNNNVLPRRVMLHLPTGVGKTRTAMSIVATHLRQRQCGVVLWLATTKELLEQSASEFELTWKKVGDRAVKIMRFWGNYSPPIDDMSDGIIFAGLAKLHSFSNDHRRLWQLGDKVSFVVFDEAHQSVARTYFDLSESIVTRNPKTKFLGLSATPGRTYNDPETDQAVADHFNGNKVTLRFGRKNPIQHLTEEGYLASVDFSTLNIRSGLDLSDKDLRLLSQSLKLPKFIVKKLGINEQRNLRIVERLLNLYESHSRILVFATSVEHAQILNCVCKAIGLKSNLVLGSTNPMIRDKVIRKFKGSSRARQILINFGVLTTGFDAPSASAVLIARPTKSLVLYSQMIGRVIRGPKAGGNSRCEVVTVVDTELPGFRSVAEAFSNWEDIWRD